jgi:hypothetical protein
MCALSLGSAAVQVGDERSQLISYGCSADTHSGASFGLEWRRPLPQLGEGAILSLKASKEKTTGNAFAQITLPLP